MYWVATGCCGFDASTERNFFVASEKFSALYASTACLKTTSVAPCTTCDMQAHVGFTVARVITSSTLPLWRSLAEASHIEVHRMADRSVRASWKRARTLGAYNAGSSEYSGSISSSSTKRNFASGV